MAINALEKIKMNIRVDSAYILGKKDPQAHKQANKLDDNFVKKMIKTGKHKGKTAHQLWLDKHNQLLKRAKKESFMDHHNQNCFKSLLYEFPTVLKILV